MSANLAIENQIQASINARYAAAEAEILQVLDHHQSRSGRPMSSLLADMPADLMGDCHEVQLRYGLMGPYAFPNATARPAKLPGIDYDSAPADVNPLRMFDPPRCPDFASPYPFLLAIIADKSRKAQQSGAAGWPMVWPCRRPILLRRRPSRWSLRPRPDAQPGCS
jgi:hypothetical protein